MATYNTSVTSSINYIPFNLSASEGLTLNIDNPDQGSSYVVLETRRNQDGFYDENTPKNAQGTYTLNGVTYIVSDDYKTGFVVPPGGGTASFDNTNYVSGSDFRVVGTAYKPFYDLLLDRWPNSAAAYSLRRLNSYYDGPAIRVRRSLDDAETNIGFSGLQLDVDTLETFCSGGDGYVKTWYDQSGNGYDATQSTASSQPKIYDSSSGVVLDNDKPTISWTINSYMINTSFNPSSSVGFSSFNVYSTSLAATANTNTQLLYTFGQQSNGYYFGKGSNSSLLTDEYILFYRNVSTSVFGRLGSDTYRRNSNTQVLESEFYLSNGFSSYQNSLVQTMNLSSDGNTTTTSDWSPASYNLIDGLYLNAFVNSLSSVDCKIQEIIFYDNSQSSNRTGIESNINSHYNIY